MPSDQSLVYDWLGIANTTPAKVAEQLDQSNGAGVDVIINSGGGDVFAGSEIYSTLKAYKGDVNVKIYGMAASAASVIAMAGDKVSISPTAQIMIHNVSSVNQGDYRDMDKMSGILKQSNGALASAYVAKTSKSKEEILKLMNDETWLDADTAVKEGFADEILFVDSEVPAMVDSTVPFLSSDVTNKILNLINEEKKKDKDKKSKSDDDDSKDEDKDSDKSKDDDKKSGDSDKSDDDKDKDKDKKSGSDSDDSDDDDKDKDKDKKKKPFEPKKKNLAEVKLNNRIRLMEMEGQMNE